VTRAVDAPRDRGAGVAQPAKFVLVGAGGYAINLAAFALLVALDVPYLAASVVSYFISNAIMYVGNRFFTFRLNWEGFWGAYLRYMIVGAVVVALNALVLVALVEGTGIDARIGQAISLLVVTPIAFVLFKRWTFRLK
jgi:putative flippase GtrA